MPCGWRSTASGRRHDESGSAAHVRRARARPRGSSVELHRRSVWGDGDGEWVRRLRDTQTFRRARRWSTRSSATRSRRVRSSRGRLECARSAHDSSPSAGCRPRVWQLIPTNVTQRVRDPATGSHEGHHDPSRADQPRPRSAGRYSSGLEVDQSKGPVPDCADAIQRAEKVVRTRIDEFGTSEPVVQIQGRCRLIVELAGEKDPARAKSISSARRSSSSASPT